MERNESSDSTKHGEILMVVPKDTMLTELVTLLGKELKLPLAVGIILEDGRSPMDIHEETIAVIAKSHALPTHLVTAGGYPSRTIREMHMAQLRSIERSKGSNYLRRRRRSKQK